MITNARDCRSAADELGITWNGEVFMPKSVAGCAWIAGGDKIQFNSAKDSITDATANRQGGICRVGGTPSDGSEDEDFTNDTEDTTEGEDEDMSEQDIVDFETVSFYRKASFAGNCDDEDQINAFYSCKEAAIELDYEFISELETDGRPAGCFWHIDGGIYFNTNMEGEASWAEERVGAVCKK